MTGTRAGPPGYADKLARLEIAFAEGARLTATVAAWKGWGCEVSVEGLRASLKRRDMDDALVLRGEGLAGGLLHVKIISLKRRPGHDDIRVSQLAADYPELAALRRQISPQLTVGQVVQGTVFETHRYGALLAIADRIALLPTSQISWGRGASALSLQIGQDLSVQVIEIAPDTGRVKVSLRALRDDPWQQAHTRYQPGATVEGTVWKVRDDSALIELEPDLVAQLHRNEMADPAPDSARRILTPGQRVTARIHRMDTSARHIALTLLPPRPRAPAEGPIHREEVGPLGVTYREASQDPTIAAAPFTPNPREVELSDEVRLKMERSLKGHATIQNALASHLATLGLEPLSPRSGEPPFDLAWRSDGVVWVVEVKSLTPANEERQLRLGLGQLLRYRNLLRAGQQSVRAVLAAEYQPHDTTWFDLCGELQILLTWPGNFAQTIGIADRGLVEFQRPN